MKLTSRISQLALVLPLLALTACGGGGGGGGGAGPPPPATASLTIVNATSVSITQVYVAPVTSDTWGANQLSAAVPPGSSRTISGIAAGSYDLRAVGSDGSHADRYGEVLAAGIVTTWTLSTPAGSLTVVNGGSFPITELYVALTTDAAWGPNQLSAAIPAGGSRTLTSIPPGSYDLRAVASNGAWVEQYGVSIAAGGVYTWTLTAPAAGSLVVVNDTSSTITELYVALTTDPTWGPDQLATTIPAGGSFTLTNVPAGVYDLRAVTAGGAWVESYGVAITTGGVYTWTITDATGSLRVVNNYTYPVTELYVSLSTDTSWGPNQIAGTTIPVYGSFTLTDIPAGTYDLAAVASDTAWWESYGHAIVAGGLFTWTLYP